MPANEEAAGASRLSKRIQRRMEKLGSEEDVVAGASEFPGMVVRKAQSKYSVDDGNRIWCCDISSKLRKDLVQPLADASSAPSFRVKVEDIRMLDPIAVGDRVLCREGDARDGTAMIMTVEPRTSKLTRRAAGKRPMEQVIVANVDLVLVVLAADKPKPKWSLLDRYLASAESDGLPASICITKMDLDARRQVDEELTLYRSLGYPVLLTCALTGQGIEELRGMLRHKNTVMVGKSGVGKTTLLNALAPDLDLRTSDVSHATGKGKHTTTNLEMHRLGEAIQVVDTPGMREFGLWNVAPEQAVDLFPEMREHTANCRFNDCTHLKEKTCALRQALEQGLIHPQRYDSFKKLKEELSKHDR